MHIKKGLSLGYFQNIFLNVILSCTLCNCKVQPGHFVQCIPEPGRPVVYYSATSSQPWPGCCVQCTREPGPPVVYHAANNGNTWVGCCVQCNPAPGQPVVYPAINDRARLGRCIQCIPEPSLPVVYHAASNDQTRLGCHMLEAAQPVASHIANKCKI